MKVSEERREKEKEKRKRQEATKASDSTVADDVRPEESLSSSSNPSPPCQPS